MALEQLNATIEASSLSKAAFPEYPYAYKVSMMVQLSTFFPVPIGTPGALIPLAFNVIEVDPANQYDAGLYRYRIDQDYLGERFYVYMEVSWVAPPVGEEWQIGDIAQIAIVDELDDIITSETKTFTAVQDVVLTQEIFTYYDQTDKTTFLAPRIGQVSSYAKSINPFATRLIIYHMT